MLSVKSDNVMTFADNYNSKNTDDVIRYNDSDEETEIINDQTPQTNISISNPTSRLLISQLCNKDIKERLESTVYLTKHLNKVVDTINEKLNVKLKGKGNHVKALRSLETYINKPSPYKKTEEDHKEYSDVSYNNLNRSAEIASYNQNDPSNSNTINSNSNSRCTTKTFKGKNNPRGKPSNSLEYTIAFNEDQLNLLTDNERAKLHAIGKELHTKSMNHFKAQKLAIIQAQGKNKKLNYSPLPNPDPIIVDISTLLSLLSSKDAEITKLNKELDNANEVITSKDCQLNNANDHVSQLQNRLHSMSYFSHINQGLS